MTADQFAALCVPPTLSLHDALARLDATACGVLLVLQPEGPPWQLWS